MRDTVDVVHSWSESIWRWVPLPLSFNTTLSWFLISACWRHRHKAVKFHKTLNRKQMFRKIKSTHMYSDQVYDEPEINIVQRQAGYPGKEVCKTNCFISLIVFCLCWYKCSFTFSNWNFKYLHSLLLSCVFYNTWILIHMHYLMLPTLIAADKVKMSMSGKHPVISIFVKTESKFHYPYPSKALSSVLSSPNSAFSTFGE